MDEFSAGGWQASRRDVFVAVAAAAATATTTTMTTMTTHSHRQRRLRYDDGNYTSVAQKTRSAAAAFPRPGALQSHRRSACACRPPRAFAGPTAGGRSARPAADRYATKEWLFTQRPPPHEARAIKSYAHATRRAAHHSVIIAAVRDSRKLEILDASRNDNKKTPLSEPSCDARAFRRLDIIQ